MTRCWGSFHCFWRLGLTDVGYQGSEYWRYAVNFTYIFNCEFSKPLKYISGCLANCNFELPIFKTIFCLNCQSSFFFYLNYRPNVHDKNPQFWEINYCCYWESNLTPKRSMSSNFIFQKTVFRVAKESEDDLASLLDWVDSPITLIFRQASLIRGNRSCYS